MSTNEITVGAPSQLVWEVLADPPTYEADPPRRLRRCTEERHRSGAARK
jgi:hypothetical protein